MASIAKQNETFLTAPPRPPFPPPQTLKNVWMINCGATEDVRALLAESGASPAATRAVVVDARRPLHHNHNHDGDAGVVLLHSRDEDDVAVEDVPLPDGASGGEEE